MRKLKWKLLFAGVLVACICGGIMLRSANATPAVGITPTLLSGPAALDEINIVSQNQTHGIIIKTRGEWESRVVRFRIVPGGHFGWHSHPGPVFVMITEGTLTLYHAEDPTTPVVYPTGSGFVDYGHTHIAGNSQAEGDVQVVAFFLTPKGSGIRIDQPAPE